ncbi:hypothetical protein RN001_014944 [Aquatica leii]|uniref:TP53-regulated inhibitor of apoptosis 1 n=1 Tax=Aquatica leii TaxID=1421715 RepID=A0AAN7PYZ1_9COLE|nr:hypothetical protein RN001_014944 [Aquatica leii]
MESLAKECQKLKEDYDGCFNMWFCENFLKGKTDDSVCAPLFKAYQECVKKAVEQRKINVKDEIRNTSGPKKLDKPEYSWLFF